MDEIEVTLMRMDSTLRRVLLTGAVAGTSVTAAFLSERRILKSWAQNPDPLNGVPVSFDAPETIVHTDDGARISTRSVGTGDPVALIHGLTGNHNDWGPIANLLIRSGRRVVTVDQRGHGDSTSGNEGYGAARMGRDLAHVFEQLDLDRVTLVGHSMGGMAILSLAVDRPDVVEGQIVHLVPISTNATMAAGRYQSVLWLGGLPLVTQPKFLDKRIELAAGLVAFGKNPSLFMVKEVIRSYEACPDDVRQKATSALRSHNLIDRLRTIDVPTTVIGGTHDLMTPLIGNEEIADRIPGARLEVADDAGHMIIWERAELIANVLRTTHATRPQ